MVNQKKILSMIVMGIMLVSVSVAIVPTIKADGPHTVVGYLYIDGEPTDGITVTLSLPSKDYESTTYNGGYYYINLDQYIDHRGETGTFEVSILGTITDNLTYIVPEEESWEIIDLHVDTTSSPNDPPYTPNNPMPSDGGTDMGLNVDLWWDGGDPDSDPVTYDVFFEANDPTPDILVSDGQSGTHYDPSTLNQDTTYYWQIIAYDDHTQKTTGPIWSFTTMDQANRQPNKPALVAPSDGTTVDSETSATLEVRVTDPDGDAMKVIFYKTDGTHIGTNSAVPNGGTASVTWSGLSSGTSYSWYAIVNDSEFENTSDTWSFKTKSGSSSPPYDPPTTSGNTPPIADASASDKVGYIGTPVNFDGSLSNDSDGTIDLYEWDWNDDGTYDYNSTSATATHTFDEVGNYSVTLRVTDDVGYRDEDTIVVVISKPNIPPTKPTVDGPTTGHKNTPYEYTVVSTDADNDTIQYLFDWGDDEKTATDFLPNGTATIQTHIWATFGEYIISVKAYDNETQSGTTEYTVLIDVWLIDDEIKGYLVDKDSDETYDSFNNSGTGEETDVEQQDDGTYLIDSDGDGGWNYVYDIETDTLTEYSGEPTTEPDNTALIVLAIIAILILIILGYLVKRSNDKKKAQKKAAEKKSQPKKKTTSKKPKK